MKLHTEKAGARLGCLPCLLFGKRLSDAALFIQPHFVGDHGDELRVGGFAAHVVDGFLL